jgi:hypothetical protein
LNSTSSLDILLVRAAFEGARVNLEIFNDPAKSPEVLDSS